MHVADDGSGAAEAEAGASQGQRAQGGVRWSSPLQGTLD